MKNLNFLKRIGSNSFVSKLLSWVIVLSVFSYPITAVGILQLGLHPGQTNFLIRVFLAGIYLILILLVLRKRVKTVNKAILPIVFFLLIYSVRLIFDISIRGIQMHAYDNFYIYSYFFGLTVLPCLGIILAKKYLDYTHLIKLSYGFLFLANILLIYQLVNQGQSLSFVEVLATRAQVRGGGDGVLINPIVVGFFGESLALFSISRMIVGKSQHLFTRLLLLSSVFIGIANILLGASRGPVLVFLVLLLFVFVYYISHEKNRVRLGMRLFGFLAVVLFLLKQFVLPFFSKTDVFLIQRLQTFSEKRGKGEVRNYIYEAAYQDFLASPVWGMQFVSTYDNFYPHNIFLEILMSLGLVGMCVFLLIFGATVRSIGQFWKRDDEKLKLPIVVVGLATLLSTLTSGSIFFSPSLWIFIILLTLISSKKYNQFGKGASRSKYYLSN